MCSRQSCIVRNRNRGSLMYVFPILSFFLLSLSFSLEPELIPVTRGLLHRSHLGQHRTSPGRHSRKPCLRARHLQILPQRMPTRIQRIDIDPTAQQPQPLKERVFQNSATVRDHQQRPEDLHQGRRQSEDVLGLD